MGTDDLGDGGCRGEVLCVNGLADGEEREGTQERAHVLRPEGGAARRFRFGHIHVLLKDNLYRKWWRHFEGKWIVSK